MLGNAAKNLGRFAQGYSGFVRKATPQSTALKAGVAAGVLSAGSSAATNTKAGPSLMGGFVPLSKNSSLKVGEYLNLRLAEKIAGGIPGVLDGLAYGAFIGSKFIDPDKHPIAHSLVDGGALATLAGTTAYGMYKDPHEFKPGLKDILGLSLMGSALYDRHKAHKAHK